MTTREWRHRVRRLTRELQTLTGDTPKGTVLSALECRLAQLTGPASPHERVAQALAELDAGLTRPAHGAPAQAECDRALGYGPDGV